MKYDKEPRRSEHERKIRLASKKHVSRKSKAKLKRSKEGKYNTDMKNKY